MFIPPLTLSLISLTGYIALKVMKYVTFKNTGEEDHQQSQDLNNTSENKAVASTALICLLCK